jgi:DNA polymerase-3 subunit beta
MALIRLKRPAVCADPDCGADLVVGQRARWYGNGRIYGLECHEQRPKGTTAETPPVRVVDVDTRIAEGERQLAELENAARKPAPKKETRKAPAPKAKVLGARLLAAVKLAAKGVSTRPGIPALTGAMLTMDPGRNMAGATLTIETTDLEVTVRQTVDFPPQSEGWRALVPARLLADALKPFGKSENVPFGPTGEGESSFRAGVAVIRTLAAEDWPNFAEISGTVATIPADRFAGAVRAVEGFASRDEARPVLTGVLVDLAGDTLEMAATDSYRMAIAEMPATSTGKARALVPARALALVAKVLGKRIDAAAVVTLTIGDAVAELGLSDGTTIRSRLIEGEFPNYRQLVPDPGAEIGTLTPGPGFSDALAAVGLLARESSPVRLELNGAVTLRASSPDLGNAEQIVAGAEYRGEDVTIAFNPAYLADVITATDGAPLEVRDALKPAVARGEGIMALVMPVRLPAPVPDVPASPSAIGPSAHEPTAAERADGAPVE